MHNFLCLNPLLTVTDTGLNVTAYIYYIHSVFFHVS